ncbi:type III-B CRISPR module-associated protein Cmr5 [Aquifex aeolicus]|uniref:CRISPR type III-B/RAMP module-associated protein Cmr5 n=1 Tax=Aquifex aeolicus (strain VF5) TaxID=224324 RepID=O66705_AQUAE|nr:type III-B CRISPR module-associated protein Cmr5 [Aquifex aeolicus]AAC06665.1 putative protein [Aquifex aeolicus VF5]
MQTRIQKVVKFAYGCVNEVKGREQIEEKYASYVRKLPSMIIHNGLLPTVAFIRSKAGIDAQNKLSPEKEAWKKIENHIKNYLIKIENVEVPDSLTRLFAEMDFSRYRLYTQKILFFTQWLKRVAEGELKSEEE